MRAEPASSLVMVSIQYPIIPVIYHAVTPTGGKFHLRLICKRYERESGLRKGRPIAHILIMNLSESQGVEE